MVGSGDSFATEGIIDGGALRNCLQEQEVCVLGGDVTLDAVMKHHQGIIPVVDPSYDYYTDTAVDITGGHSVRLDLNGHKVTANIPINIENGNLLVENGVASNQGSINFTNTLKNIRTGLASWENVEPQFRMVGSKDSEKNSAIVENYSVLKLGSGIQVTSTENEVIRVSTGTDAVERSFGTVVEIDGAELSDVPYAIIVDDYNGAGSHGAKADNAPKISIKNAKVDAKGYALKSGVFSNWNIENSTIESSLGNVIYVNNGQFVIDGADTKLSTEVDNAAIFETHQGSRTNEASIIINDGTFQSTGTDGVFYNEPNVSGQDKNHKTIGNLEIRGGTFTASNLFNTESRFNEMHSGFITGGTWGPEWDEENDNILVASDYLKDFDESLGEGSNVMTVTKPSVEGLPEGYTLDLSRRVINDDEILKAILEKAGIQGTALNQYIEANLYNADGIQERELPDGAGGITLRIGGFDGIPGLRDGVSRQYYIISMHDSGDPENPEIYTIGTTYDEETGEVILPNLTKFSNFIIAYEDTAIPAEEEKAPASPDTGAEATSQASGAVTSALALFMLAGSAITTFAGIKLFRKK